MNRQERRRQRRVNKHCLFKDVLFLFRSKGYLGVFDYLHSRKFSDNRCQAIELKLIKLDNFKWDYDNQPLFFSREVVEDMKPNSNFIKIYRPKPKIDLEEIARKRQSILELMKDKTL